MTDDNNDRKVVKTYVPSYQKDDWREHADDLGMSQSEFVKSMVQAGRRGFDIGSAKTDKPDSEGETPGVNGLEDRVLDILDGGYYSWDELVDALTEKTEDRLEETLQHLQHENRVRYNGRQGGYTTDNDA